MSRNIIILIAFFVALLFFNSCAQLGSLQTANVLEKNETLIGGAAYGVTTHEIDNGLNTVMLPQAEILLRKGLGKNTDIGIKAATSGSVLMEGKYQYWGKKNNSLLAAAIGGGIELNLINVSEHLVFRTHLPLYFSCHPNEKNAVYATPRLMYQTVVSDDDNALFLGGSLGYWYAFENNLNLAVESSWYNIEQTQAADDNAQLFQLGIGLVYKFGR